jgi:hypothetical protein
MIIDFSQELDNKLQRIQDQINHNMEQNLKRKRKLVGSFSSFLSFLKKFSFSGHTSPSNEDLPGQQSEDELNHGLERLIELAKFFQLQQLRKRLETIKQSRQRDSNRSDQSIGQIKSRFHYTRDAL